MISNTWTRKFVSMWVAAAILIVYSVVITAAPAALTGSLSVVGEVRVDDQNGVAGVYPPQQFVARLATRGNQPITVNGASAVGGASILTGATIETPDQVGATINLGSLGELEIAPNTKLTLEFDANGNVK